MILLTGGTGFLGKHLLEELAQRGEKVRMLVRNPSKVKDLPSFVEVVEGDVLDVLSIERAMEGVDYVIHSAAVVSFWKKRHAEMRRINIEGTANLVDAALSQKVKKFVQVSSIAALGRPENPTRPLSESTKWVNSKFNPVYGRTKYLAELEVCRGVAEGMSAAMVNPGIIIGPANGNWDSGSPKIFKVIHRRLRFYNPGSSGFVAALDVARAIHLLLDSQHVAGQRFVMVSDNLSYKDFFAQVAGALGVKAPSTKPPAFLAKLVGRLSQFISGITGKEPIITPETTRTSSGTYSYDGSLITRELDFQYRDLGPVVAETAQKYLQENGN